MPKHQYHPCATVLQSSLLLLPLFLLLLQVRWYGKGVQKNNLMGRLRFQSEHCHRQHDAAENNRPIDALVFPSVNEYDRAHPHQAFVNLKQETVLEKLSRLHKQCPIKGSYFIKFYLNMKTQKLNLSRKEITVTERTLIQTHHLLLNLISTITLRNRCNY